MELFLLLFLSLSLLIQTLTKTVKFSFFHGETYPTNTALGQKKVFWF